MDRLLGIGDFARLVGLSVSAVRFYADRGLLIPARIDPSSRYRSFDPDQVAAGRLVRDLRLIGVPLAQVKAALILPASHVHELVEVHIAGLEAELQAAQRTAGNLGSAIVSDSLVDQATTVAAAELIRAFEQVLPFASTDPEQPHLMTVLIEVKAGSVRIVTTDTHRLAVRDLVALDSGPDFTTLISAAAARRWLTKLRPEQEVLLRLDGRSLTASNGEVAASARIVPSDFPDYEVFLTAGETSTAIIVDREAFADVLQQFDDATGAVLLSAGRSQLRIHRRDLSVQIDGDHDGDDVHVAIDPAYGVEAAASALGSELVIEIESDPLRPVLFRSATNGTYVSFAHAGQARLTVAACARTFGSKAVPRASTVAAMRVSRLHLADVTPSPDLPWARPTFPVFAFLVEHPDGPVLIDTGVGLDHDVINELYSPVHHDLDAALAARGVEVSDIATVITSHLHFDHCGQNSRFPHAQVLVQRAEVEAAKEPLYTIPEWAFPDGVELTEIEGDHHVARGIEIIATPGHTVGHQSVLIDDGNGHRTIACCQGSWDAESFNAAELGDDGWDQAVGARSMRRVHSLQPTAVLFSHDAAVWNSDDSTAQTHDQFSPARRSMKGRKSSTQPSMKSSSERSRGGAP